MNLQNLTPDELLALKRQLDSLAPSSDGRTPFRERQLHDLNRKPAANDARPLFVWSADSPVDYRPMPGPPFPALIWHKQTGEERTVYSAAEQASYGTDWQTVPPTAAPVAVDPMADLQAALDALSPEDRAAVLRSQKQARMASLTERLAGLSPDELDSLLPAPTPAKKTA
jgi:hypothetical protein